MARVNIVLSTMWNILTGEIIFDHLFFTDQDKSIGVGYEHTLLCVIQPHKPIDFQS